MKQFSTFFMNVLLFIGFISIVASLPNPAYNPNSEYELISGGAQAGPKPTFVPITRKPLIIQTPPPTPANSKTFAFNPKDQSWTLVKKNDPIPAEDTLLWNQSNDKWLTNTPHRL